MKKKMLTYKSSGVDIDQANAFVDGIKGLVRATQGPGVMTTAGGFGGLFALDRRKYRDPVLVSSTDGVGTKLLLAQAAGRHNTVGIDLVAMNVNDILCVGARPLFFLDYIACGRLDRRVLKSVVAGIARGCQQAGCSLIGGETAEMPGLYGKEEYDLAGFAVGVVERKKIIDGTRIQAGDRVIGLASSGFHSNGYSLVRRVFSFQEQRDLASLLLRPTRIYVPEVLDVTARYDIKGIAHITGGAFYDKLTKILPKGLCFAIDPASWRRPKVFHLLQDKGRVPEAEMFRTFNMGIGMVLVAAPRVAGRVMERLAKLGLRSYDIGEVVRDARRKVTFVAG